MNVEDMASQISVIFGIQLDRRGQISGDHVSPASTETLAKGGEITKSFNSELIQQHLCKQLPRSVNMR